MFVCVVGCIVCCCMIWLLFVLLGGGKCVVSFVCDLLCAVVWFVLCVGLFVCAYVFACFGCD